MSELGRFYDEDDGIVSGMIRDYTRRYGILKSRLRREEYIQLATGVDEAKEASFRLLGFNVERTEGIAVPH
jgi:hypothetical protein